MAKPVVLVTEGSSPNPLAWLKEQAEVLEVGPGDAGFEEALARAEGMVVRTYTTVDAELLENAPNLRVVGRGGVGLESIDVPACRQRGVQVVYTPDANTKSVRDLVAGFMVKLVRPWHANRPEMFDPSDFKQLRSDAGGQLSELTLGILGLGRVGSTVARMARLGFDMNVIYHDLLPIESEHATAVSFDDLIDRCDILTLHVDGRPENRHLINSDMLGRSNFRYLINTSRGMVVDVSGLADLVNIGKLDGIALDVHDPEPPTRDQAYDRLLNFPDRVLLTPHMASRTTTAMENMSWVVRDVIGVLEGAAPRYPAP